MRGGAIASSRHWTILQRLVFDPVVADLFEGGADALDGLLGVGEGDAHEDEVGTRSSAPRRWARGTSIAPRG